MKTFPKEILQFLSSIGTPIARATAELISVPMIYGKAPNDSRPSTEFQSVLVKNLKPSKENIFSEPFPTAYNIRASIKRVYAGSTYRHNIKNLVSSSFPVKEKRRQLLVTLFTRFCKNNNTPLLFTIIENS